MTQIQLKINNDEVIATVENPERLKYEVETRVEYYGVCPIGCGFWNEEAMAFNFFPTHIYCYNSENKSIAKFKLKNHK